MSTTLCLDYSLQLTQIRVRDFGRLMTANTITIHVSVVKDIVSRGTGL